MNVLPLTSWAYFDNLVYKYSNHQEVGVPIYQAAKSDSTLDFEKYEDA